MSRSVELFIATDTPADDLARAIAARAGLSVEYRADDGAPVLANNQTSAVLHEHAYVDDGDLRFSRYRYALSARTSAADRIGEQPETRLLRTVAAALGGDLDVLLVLDTQFRIEPPATDTDEAIP